MAIGHGDFNLQLLFAAMDSRRRTEGLTWPQVSSAIGGIAPSTLLGVGTRTSVEADGVLQILWWLGRTPESYIPGGDEGAHDPEPWPALTRPQKLRFDAPKLHAALNEKRVALGLSWKQVAEQVGGMTPGMLTRLAAPGRLSFPGVMRLTQWLGRPALEFTRIANE